MELEQFLAENGFEQTTPNRNMKHQPYRKANGMVVNVCGKFAACWAYGQTRSQGTKEVVLSYLQNLISLGRNY